MATDQNFVSVISYKNRYAKLADFSFQIAIKKKNRYVFSYILKKFGIIVEELNFYLFHNRKVLDKKGNCTNTHFF